MISLIRHVEKVKIIKNENRLAVVKRLGKGECLTAKGLTQGLFG